MLTRVEMEVELRMMEKMKIFRSPQVVCRDQTFLKTEWMLRMTTVTKSTQLQAEKIETQRKMATRVKTVKQEQLDSYHKDSNQPRIQLHKQENPIQTPSMLVNLNNNSNHSNHKIKHNKTNIRVVDQSQNLKRATRSTTLTQQ